MENLSNFFKALSDDTRLKIIRLLTEHEMCVCELEERLGMSQPAVSHHLGMLKKSGLISGRRQGKWMYYSINGKEFLDKNNEFKELALLAVEERIANGLPASPTLNEEESYCKLMLTKQKR